MENTTVNNRKRLPSDLDQVLTVAKYDVLKHFRSKRLLGLLILEGLVLALMFALPLALDVDVPEDAASYMSSYVSWVSMLVVIGATMFAGDAIVSEFQGRTGYLLFPNPVKREAIFLGKYLSTISIIGLMVVLYYGIAALLTLVMTGESTVLWVYSMLFALVYGAAAAAVGFLLSTIFKGSTGSLVLTFFMLLMILPLVMAVVGMAGYDTVYIMSSAEYVIGGLMDDPYVADGMLPDIGASLVVLSAYVAGCLLAGLVLFKRREMVS